MNNKTYQELKEIISKLVIDPNQIEIKKDMRLKEDLGFDSLLIVSLILDIEEYMSIIFNESDLDPSELLTVQDLADLVESTKRKCV